MHLTESERETLDRFSVRIDADLHAAVEAILTARLAEAEHARDMALSVADSMQHFADVAEVCERKSNAYAARLSRVATLAEEWGTEGPSQVKHAYDARDVHEGLTLERCAAALRAALAAPDEVQP